MVLRQTPFVPQSERAKTFLYAALSDGPRPAEALKAAAAVQGISASTLQRARVALHISSHRDRQSGTYVWCLPTPQGAITQAPFQLFTVLEDEHHAEAAITQAPFQRVTRSRGRSQQRRIGVTTTQAPFQHVTLLGDNNHSQEAITQAPFQLFMALEDDNHVQME